jgi:hypothetical protein
LLDKMLGLLDILAIKVPFYFVADAYYAAGKMGSVTAMVTRQLTETRRSRSCGLEFGCWKEKPEAGGGNKR